MLRELLQLVESADGPLSLADLSRQLNVDASTLDGMLQHWVRKGRLVVDGRSGAACGEGCVSAGCGCGSCSGLSACPFIARLPVTYRINRGLNESQTNQTAFHTPLAPVDLDV